MNGISYGDPEPKWVDVGPSSYPGTSKYADSNGQFWDAPMGDCANVAFSASWTQPISILVGSSRYTVRTNKWQWAMAA